MKKVFIKMNNSDAHLSLGNIFRIIKELSKNKSSALQTEIFCALFGVSDINDTTVNNYCVGCRKIGNDYKQIYLNFQKRYLIDNSIFVDIVISILSIIDGRLYLVDKDKVDFINNNRSMLDLCKKLFNITKNDKSVTADVLDKINRLYKNGDYYSQFVESLFFAILSKKQPLYEMDVKKEVIENLLNDTYISSKSLEEYLAIKLKESINYDYSLRRMALEGNAYAAFEIATNEYNGYVKGFPRYEEAYKYLEIAVSYNHAGALYMVGNMYYRGYIGNKTKEDYRKGFDYLEKARDLGNIAALNVLGLYYLDGVYPARKNEKKALDYFSKAADNNYAFSLNNLGKYYETTNKELAFDYYLKSASLGESWACNKVGECYRIGYLVEKDEKKSFYYYQEGLKANYRTMCYYNYYNLANYYISGRVDLGIIRDVDKAIKYYKIASDYDIIEASIKLLYYYVDKYLLKRNDYLKEIIAYYKNRIENHKKYNMEIKKNIEDMVKKIYDTKEISIDFIFNS